MESIGNALLALLIIAEAVTGGIAKVALAIQSVTRWSWKTPLGVIITTVALMVLWILLGDHAPSIFFAWSTFITSMVTIVYALRTIVVLIEHDAQHEKPRRRPKHRPATIPDWCEPTPVD